MGCQKEKREQEINDEKIMKKFPNLINKRNIQAQEAYRVPNKMDPKRPTPIHNIFKMPKFKDKEKNLKAARKKAINYLQGISQQKHFRPEEICTN